MIVMKPTLKAFHFLHHCRTLHSLFINSFLLYISVTARWYQLCRAHAGHGLSTKWTLAPTIARVVQPIACFHTVPSGLLPSTNWSCLCCCRELEIEDLIRRCNWTPPPPPPPQQREINDQCTCSSVEKVSGRVAGVKSKGKFLEGGGALRPLWPSGGLPMVGVLYTCVRSHCSSQFESKCACTHLCAWMCNRESNCKREKDGGGGGGGGGGERLNS